MSAVSVSLFKKKRDPSHQAVHTNILNESSYPAHFLNVSFDISTIIILSMIFAQVIHASVTFLPEHFYL